MRYLLARNCRFSIVVVAGTPAKPQGLMVKMLFSGILLCVIV